MELEDITQCQVPLESFKSGRKACKECVLFDICSIVLEE